MVKKGLDRCIAPGRTFNKVLEGGGMSVRRMLGKTNSFPRAICGRRDSPLVGELSSCRDMCFQMQIGKYESAQDAMMSSVKGYNPKIDSIGGQEIDDDKDLI